jgi:hypothetical protein
MKINIVNSLHPQAIGDAISAFPILWALARAAPLSVYFSCAAVRPLCTFAEVADQPLDGPTLDVQEFAAAAEVRGLHLAQSWFWRLGMEPPTPPFAWPEFPVTMPRAKFDLAVAPFSNSDPRGDKVPRIFWSARWPLAHWLELLSGLDEKRVCLLCAGSEEMGGLRELATILAGRDLREVCGVLRNSAVVLTIDNGIGWLAQALGCQHVLLQPSRHFRGWTNNPNANAVNLPNSARVGSLFKTINMLFDGKPVSAERDVAFDRKIARLALLRAARFAVRGDRESAAASYRVWRQHATPAQLVLAGLEPFIAVGHIAASQAGRRFRREQAPVPGNRRQA